MGSLLPQRAQSRTYNTCLSHTKPAAALLAHPVRELVELEGFARVSCAPLLLLLVYGTMGQGRAGQGRGRGRVSTSGNSIARQGKERKAHQGAAWQSRRKHKDAATDAAWQPANTTGETAQQSMKYACVRPVPPNTQPSNPWAHTCERVHEVVVDGDLGHVLQQWAIHRIVLGQSSTQSSLQTM